MRTSLLLIASAALFVGYSTITMATSGAASFIASPMLFAAIGLLVTHDKVTSQAN